MNKTTRTSALAIVALFASTAMALAADEYNVSSGITTTGAQLGIHGVDPVVLSSTTSVANPDGTYASVHDSVAYYFVSAESQSLFENNPERYLPQYGGFCAYAIALGKKFDGNPRYADVMNGKLYLFVNAAVLAEYMKDREGWIARAEARWPSIRSIAVADL